MTAPIQKPRRDDIPGVLGERVREERNRQGITRERLAEMAGVSVDVIKRVEDGMGAKIEAAYYIAVALHTPLEALLPMQVCCWKNWRTGLYKASTGRKRPITGSFLPVSIVRGLIC